LFPNKKAVDPKVTEYFDTMTAYRPAFTSYDGGVYEMELTRAAIHSFASAVSKLKPEFVGSAYQNLGNAMAFKANEFMTTSKFLYRLATILSVNTTAFIIPIYKKDMQTLTGYYPILPTGAEVVSVDGEPWLRYTFPNGDRAAMELSRVGVITQHQYRSDFFGEGNGALNPTLSVMDIQKQSMLDAVEQSATIRFMARMGMEMRPEDIKKERARFSADNLSNDNDTGVMMFDSKYAEVKQIDSKPYTINTDQMEQIRQNVFNYFGVNEDILQNKFDEETWNAFYEGKIEPFALQLGLELTKMTFTENEIAHGNHIMFSSNRLQYASNATKLQMSTQLFDRGILSANMVNDIWNLPHVEGGDERYIRKEYGKVGDEDAEGIYQRV